MENTERAWCHRCKDYVATREVANRELECLNCGSTFVEREGQNVEMFIAPSPSPPSISVQSSRNTGGGSSSVDTSPGQNGNEVIQQILTRIFNLGTGQPTLLNLMQDAAAESGRPIGFVVRQRVSPHEMSAISSMLASRSGNVTIGARQVGGGPQHIFSQSRQFGALGSLLGLGDHGAEGGIPDHSFENLLHHILMNETSYRGVPPASTETIRSLSRQNVTDESCAKALGECSITQEAFDVGDTAITLPCGHRFKQQPIEHWLGMHNTCPVCRVNLPEQPV